MEHSKNLVAVLFMSHITCLELKLERQLDRARAADLIQWAESAVGPTGAQAARQRLRRVAEKSVGQSIVGRAEVGVVEDIEELSPKAEIHLFSDAKLPLNCNIGLPSSETAQHIAREIALLTAGRWGKRCGIENLAARISRPIENERHSRVYVRAQEEFDA